MRYSVGGDDHRAGGRPGARVRAVGDGRAPVRLRGGAGDRRLGATAARGPRGDRAGRRRRAATATTCSPRCGRDPAATPSASSTGCAITSTTDTSRRRTAVRLVGLLRDLMSPNPVEQYPPRPGKVGTPGALIDELVVALTRAIEELTRPVDAIKHQAKTVTVGISRSDEGVVDRALVQAVLQRRRRARRAHATARSRCSPISTRRSPRSPASPATRIDDDDDLDRRPRRASPATCQPGRRATRGWSAPSTVSPSRARCSWHAAGATGAR